MKKLLAIILLIIDAGFLIWIIASKPYKSRPSAQAYSGDAYSAQSTAMTAEREDENRPAAPAENPSSEATGAHGSQFDSFILGDAPDRKDSAPVSSDSSVSPVSPATPAHSEEAPGYSEDIPQFAEEDPGYSEEEEDGGQLSMRDFSWFDPHLQWDRVPEGAEPFTDFGRMKGGWKAYIDFDPDNAAGRRLDMLLYVTILGEEDNVTLEYDWYWARDLNTEGEEGHEDNDDHSYYYGTYDNGEIHGSGAGNVDLRCFYEMNGTEYAVGTMASMAGVPAIICLKRP